MPDMCYHDICNSLVENYNGEDHYEVCHNVYKGIAWQKINVSNIPWKIIFR